MTRIRSLLSVVAIVFLLASTGPVSASATTFQSPIDPTRALCANDDLPCWVKVFFEAFDHVKALLGNTTPVASVPSVQVAPAIDENCEADKGVGFIVTGTMSIVTANDKCPSAFEWNQKSRSGASANWGVFVLWPGQALSFTVPATKTFYVDGTRWSLGADVNSSNNLYAVQRKLSDEMYRAWVANGGDKGITVPINYLPSYATLITLTLPVTDTALKADEVVVEDVSGKSAASLSAETPLGKTCRSDTLPFSVGKGSWRLGSPDEGCASLVVYTSLTNTAALTASVYSFVLPANNFVFVPQGYKGIQVFSGMFVDEALAQEDASAKYCEQLTAKTCVFKPNTLPGRAKFINSH